MSEPDKPIPEAPSPAAEPVPGPVGRVRARLRRKRRLIGGTFEENAWKDCAWMGALGWAVLFVFLGMGVWIWTAR